MEEIKIQLVLYMGMAKLYQGADIEVSYGMHNGVLGNRYGTRPIGQVCILPFSFHT